MGDPFVRPVGLLLLLLLDVCLQAAGVDRSQHYATNAVKHFKFEQRGKRRLHAGPTPVKRCAWRLVAELQVRDPQLTVAMGATAFYALTDHASFVTRERGNLSGTPGGKSLLVTIHPSDLLRLPDREDAQEERQVFVKDLRKITDVLAGENSVR
ncbi:hypothetical protein G6L74_25650 [Agrobacterium tumefaciens]|uniref:uracil-DNA glycosylase family protein n=2 Tax=Rhizobium/Agrobacterium group TaxID=227290 RepID=UPI0015720651|nr:hypothetical protein [Agrobacterium tumefaciens]